MDDTRGNSGAQSAETGEAAAHRRGQLKIFFGYAAGVGKTYAMLKAAHSAKKRGVDVVVGYVQAHARPQTAALLQGLEQLAPMTVRCQELVTTELDLDAVARRSPQLVLVDELAHTNAGDCRHAKRYQDVEELLRLGIDVYTTVNVQHIESLNDIVSSVTGVLVQERIPDKMFDNADQVELVDLEPEELLERLRSGKIYKQEHAQQALAHFFTLENLVALREIALRRCADRVNKISERARQAQGGDYHTDEHILVCLSPSPSNAKILRTAARMADAFKGNFTALFVETPAFSAMGEADKATLRANMTLAQQLGATIETVYGDDVPFQIAEFARLTGASKIVVGRGNARRTGVWRKPSLAECLADAAPNLDVYSIPDKDAAHDTPARAKLQPFYLSAADVGKSAAVLALATAIGFVFHRLGFSEANIITVYILGVLVTAVITSHRVYSLVLSVVSVLTFNFFFTVPLYTLQAYDSGYPVTFFIMLVSAFLTGTLAAKIKQHAKQSAQTAFRTKILLETNQLLQKAADKPAVAAVAAKQLTKLLRRDIVFYLVEHAHLQAPAVFAAGEDAPPADCVNEKEQAVAEWVYQNNQRAGATTGTLGGAKCLYLAVRVNDTVYGVVGIVMADEPLDAFESSIVLSLLGECALALENQQVLAEREAAAVLAKNEQLRANLLRSISHDLRTPLTSISGSAGILLASEDAIGKEKRRALYTDIYDDALWLINLVENLLSVTRIEDGTVRLRKTAELLEEAVAEALSHLSRQSAQHTIAVEQADEFIVVKMDARLIVQVLVNLVGNAVKYTPPGSHIVVRVSKQDAFAQVQVADDGPGIPDDAKPKIFDMFYTSPGAVTVDSRRSLGLGLALCKSIVTAHGGTLCVHDNVPQGTVFSFTLPLEEVELHA